MQPIISASQVSVQRPPQPLPGIVDIATSEYTMLRTTEEVELIVPIGRRCLCTAARGEGHNLTNRLPRYIQDTIFVRQCRRELCGDLSKPTGCLPV